jgi:hypothetical protein
MSINSIHRPFFAQTIPNRKKPLPKPKAHMNGTSVMQIAEGSEDMQAQTAVAAALFAQINAGTLKALSNITELNIKALPPGGQEAREREAVLADPRLKKLLGDDEISSITKSAQGYAILTTSGMLIEARIQHLPNPDIVGPLPFSIEFSKPHLYVGELQEKWQFPSNRSDVTIAY